MKYLITMLLFLNGTDITAQTCWSAAYQVLTRFEIGRREISLEKKLDLSDYRTNPDGTRYYRTCLALVTHRTLGRKRKVLDTGLYTSADCVKDMLPCLLIDTAEARITIFASSKAADRQYGMEGYSYSSDLQLKKFQKRTIFKKVNAGWYSFFGGSEKGEPELWHFSADGYYAVLSKQKNGFWDSYIIGHVEPSNVISQYELHDNVLYASQPRIDRMFLEKLETKTL